jgi:glucose-1-phosphate cytidylyltransferase
MLTNKNQSSSILRDYHPKNIPVVLLAGGLGTRIKEETETKPKPMIEIGQKPVLWHLMKYFVQFGHNEFIICGGFKSEKIAEYFQNYKYYNQDFTISYGKNVEVDFHGSEENFDWKVTVAHTGGKEVGTGGRILKVKNYLKNRTFICTYGDGLSDIEIPKLISNHMNSRLRATITAIHPKSRYGVLELVGDKVTSFHEKPQAEGWINGGFFIFNPEIFNYLTPNCSLENDTLVELARDSQLNYHKHEGFWQSMDTFREYELLNKLWNDGEAPWKIWP